MHLAYFSPLPPTHSGIADYSRELLAPLSEHAELTLFVDDPSAVDPNLSGSFRIEPISGYVDSRYRYDMALYHIGNNVHHESIYQHALRYPGVVVLHDLYIHHFIGYLTFVRGDYASYGRELTYALGRDGLDLYSDIKLGRRRFPAYELPLCNRLVDRSLGVIVHSKSAAGTVQAMRPERPARIIPALIQGIEGKSNRQDLGLSEQTVIFASLGFVNPTKQIELALRSFARLRRIEPNIFYIIVGDVQGDLDISGVISELGLDEAVRCTGYVENLQAFVDWTSTADVVINLRYPTLGETSAAALRAMAAGKPLIVFDHGWYGELPDNVCKKVPPLDSDALFESMLELAREPESRTQLGKNALTRATNHHNPRKVAEEYTEFVNVCLKDIERRA